MNGSTPFFAFYIQNWQLPKNRIKLVLKNYCFNNCRDNSPAMIFIFIFPLFLAPRVIWRSFCLLHQVNVCRGCTRWQRNIIIVEVKFGEFYFSPLFYYPLLFFSSLLPSSISFITSCSIFFLGPSFLCGGDGVYTVSSTYHFSYSTYLI